ncbi:SDR family oxidoreductase [Microlunatus panaciterrae]|uniref:NADH dehydrogenase n=1 Tax=Microlunatus panaciterrae TaxID=400768 RepID=A0ABS2RFR3_9ACTN|nr:NAD(P)H-binding protein [Microlunatus panaciterrae]MBM7797849.1 NADH dehydrogenase [Microlunatus panaciterrae]
MIVLIGGTGRLGEQVLSRLEPSGIPLRVVARHPPTERWRDDHPRVEWRLADVRDRTEVDQVLAGARTVVSMVHGFSGTDGNSPETVDRGGNISLIEAAEKIGADLVLLSVTGAAADSPMELHRMKYAAEQRLRHASIGWTIVRSEAFMETWAGLLEQTAGRSKRPQVFGRGDNPIAFVSVKDVAEVVSRVVQDPSLRGRILEITGPETFTLRRLAAAVMAAHQWPGSPRRVPRGLLRVMALATGRIRPMLARQARAALAMDELPSVIRQPPLPGIELTQLGDVLHS